MAEGVEYVVSPYETDAQIAHMLSIGHANFAVTEDSDLLVYGCKNVCMMEPYSLAMKNKI